MEEDVAKAINEVSKKIMRIESQLSKALSNQIDKNKSSIEDTDMAVIELAALITDSKQKEEISNG